VHRYIKAVGAGQKRARALSRVEAAEAMALCVGGAEPVQVGAFLLALRMKGETPEELAGFCEALEAHMGRAGAPAGTLEVDAHGDGHAGVPSLLPAAACAAAALGTPVALSVELGSPKARHGLDAALGALGFSGTLDAERAARDLGRAGVGVLDLQAICPPAARLCALRPLLGVRTAAQTVAKLLSPLGAGARLVGIFHAPYLEPTARALALGGALRGLVVQQLGGLPEAVPGKKLRVACLPGVELEALDLLALGGAGALEEDAVAANAEALSGRPGAARARAAASAGLMIHAATQMDLLAAAAAADQALADGRAEAIAVRLRGR
jgi:anthranilate phosphoribosyltransferase